MNTRLLAAVLLLGVTLFAARGADAQCCGDCNGDGSVAINELITAVNNSLNGCNGTGPTPTPTSPPDGTCPIDFADDNTRLGTPDCLYAGRWNPDCGDDRLETIWRSQGSSCANPPCIVAVFFTEFDSVDCGAEIDSANRATLFGCFLGPDDDDFVETSGDVMLGTDGATLTMDPDDAPFTIGDDQCGVTLYQGNLTDVITPSPAAAQRRSSAELESRLQRLRQARKPTPEPPNLPRN